ncbi:MmcQ/YjbR family DNA-binding protein [Salinivirga cyanobacteriivorans]
MNSEEIRNYCIAKKHTTESFPFDEYSLVFKVAGKMFALLDLEAELRMNLKCDPEYALQLREKYASIQPGYHMNKKHWNTIYFDGTLSRELVFKLVDHSYNLVVSKLPKNRRIACGL